LQYEKRGSFIKLWKIGENLQDMNDVCSMERLELSKNVCGCVDVRMQEMISNYSKDMQMSNGRKYAGIKADVSHD